MWHDENEISKDLITGEQNFEDRIFTIFSIKFSRNFRTRDWQHWTEWRSWDEMKFLNKNKQRARVFITLAAPPSLIANPKIWISVVWNGNTDWWESENHPKCKFETQLSHHFAFSPSNIQNDLQDQTAKRREPQFEKRNRFNRVAELFCKIKSRFWGGSNLPRPLLRSSTATSSSRYRCIIA